MFLLVLVFAVLVVGLQFAIVVDGLRLSANTPSRVVASDGSNQWFKEGLSFGCTGCGKCCKVDGDVWLAPDEQPAIAAALGEPTVDSFVQKFTRDQIKGWVLLNLKPPPENLGCIFLSDETGQCSIYEHRPVQCRTYPFWPSLLGNRKEWEDEAVLPDDDEISNVDTTTDNDTTNPRRWTPEDGGCEGINHCDAPLIPADEIESKRREARKHWRSFPDYKIKHETWYI